MLGAAGHVWCPRPLVPPRGSTGRSRLTQRRLGHIASCRHHTAAICRWQTDQVGNAVVAKTAGSVPHAHLA